MNKYENQKEIAKKQLEFYNTLPHEQREFYNALNYEQRLYYENLNLIQREYFQEISTIKPDIKDKKFVFDKEGEVSDKKPIDEIIFRILTSPLTFLIWLLKSMAKFILKLPLKVLTGLMVLIILLAIIGLIIYFTLFV